MTDLGDGEVYPGRLGDVHGGSMATMVLGRHMQGSLPSSHPPFGRRSSPPTVKREIKEGSGVSTNSEKGREGGKRGVSTNSETGKKEGSRSIDQQ